MAEAEDLLQNPARLLELSRNMEILATPSAAERVVDEIEKLI
jgi:uncharacterized protein (DUF2384 family)